MIAADWIVADPETLAVPSNDALVQLMSPVALMVRPVVSCAAEEAVEALPDKVAVMVPALKLPDASLATMALAVFALVAVVAELGMVVDAVIAPVPLPYT